MFYIYHQNNSGGEFIRNDKVDICVIIEALSSESANIIAEKEVGIYFDGVKAGKDCPCCGDRWMRSNDRLGKRIIEEHLDYSEETKIYPLNWHDLK